MILVFLDSDFAKESKLFFKVIKKQGDMYTTIAQEELTNINELPEIIISVDSVLNDKFRLVAFNISADRGSIINHLTKLKALKPTEVNKARDTKLYKALVSKETASKTFDVYRVFLKALNTDSKLLSSYKTFCIKNLHIKGTVNYSGDYKYVCRTNQETIGTYYKIYGTKLKKQSHQAKSDTEELYSIFKKMKTKKVFIDTEDVDDTEGDNTTSSIYRNLSLTDKEMLNRGLSNIMIEKVKFPPLFIGDIQNSEIIKKKAREVYNKIIEGFNPDNYFNGKTVDYSKLKSDVGIVNVKQTSGYTRAVSSAVTRKTTKTGTTKLSKKVISEEEVKERLGIINALYTISDIKEIENISKGITTIIDKSQGSPLGILSGYRDFFTHIKKNNTNKAIEILSSKFTLDSFQTPLNQTERILFGFIVLSTSKQFMAEFMDVITSNNTMENVDKMFSVDFPKEQAEKVSKMERHIADGSKIGIERIKKIIASLKRNSKFSPNQKIKQIKPAIQNKTNLDYINQRVLFLTSNYYDRKKGDKELKFDTYVSRCYIIANIELAILTRGQFHMKSVSTKQQDEFGNQVAIGIDLYLYNRNENANGLFWYFTPSYREYNSLIIGFKRKTNVKYYIYKGFTQKNIIDILLRMLSNDSLGYAVWQILRTSRFKGKYTPVSNNLQQAIDTIKSENTKYGNVLNAISKYTPNQFDIFDLL